MDKYIGKMLDNRYEILEVIGVGGMAVVYKAKCHRLNRYVAVKILKEEYAQDEEFRRRFQAESRAVAMLSHPNIVAVYDVSQSGDIDYIVMELIDGITLKQYMEKKGVLNWRETLHFSMQIAKALEHAHSRGIVHRDIKPHNIMVLKNGSIKVADFGIARVSSAQSTLTREALGSVHYISPEQARGGRVDNRSDIYSLGVVMYEMLTGRPPYDGESPVAVAIKHINAGAPMPSQLNPNIPGGLEQITMHAMCADVNERYSSATEMLYDLEEFRKNPDILFDFGSRTAPRPTRPQRPAAPPRRQPARQPEKTPAERRAEERARRRKLEEERRQAKRRRTRNTVIAVAAIVLVILGIVLVVNSCSSDKATVEVPNFVDQVFADIDTTQYPDLVIVEGGREYSDTVEEGHVIRQTPEAKKMVTPGSTVKLVVSLGVQDNNMPNLLKMRQSDAEKLLDDLKLDLNIRIESVFDDDVEKDCIVRSDPAAGQPLTSGQTVTLYVSKGSETLLVQVPNVKDQTLTKAISMLTAAKLEYVANYVESDKAKDTVLSQSVDAGEEVKEGTVITLEVSKGPADEEPDPEPVDPDPVDPKPEPEPNPTTQTVLHTITIPDHDSAVTVEVICADDGSICGEPQELAPGENSISISLTGSGSLTYNVYVNSNYDSSFVVDFSS